MWDDHTDCQIKSIQFGIYSPEDLIKRSVCNVNSNKMTGPNSVYDENMGTIENNKNCTRCGQNNKHCPGHFGHICLNYNIIHPLYFKMVVAFLKCFCIKCSKILISEDKLKLNGILKYSGESRFNKILDLVEKVEICPCCNNVQPKYMYVSTESVIYMIFKRKYEQIKTPLIENEILNVFENIEEEHVRLLGMNPDNILPKNLILQVLPVIPPVARPYIIADGMTCDDDLTLQYLEIIKTNNHLDDHTIPESKRQKYIQSIKFRIKCLFDNSQDKAKHTNGRPMKAIKKRIAGKDGHIRSNLMGKRVNQSGRTVIGPDPTLGLGEIAIPKEMARILTYPERVTGFNMEYLTNLIENGKANYVTRKNAKDNSRINLKYALKTKQSDLQDDDVITRYFNGKSTKITINNYNIKGYKLKPGDEILRNGQTIKGIPETKRDFKLNIGDVVDRQLKDGDIVLLNRQPTLHKGSMLAQTIKIKDAKTIRMNLAITKTFNADFDGDEMNIHAPSTPEVETELRELAATQHNLISTQSSKPNIAIVQDALVASYLMTLPVYNPEFSKYALEKHEFFQIATQSELTPTQILDGIEHVKNVLKELGKDYSEKVIYNGRTLISLVLPKDLIYSRKNNSTSSEPILKIHKGVIHEGVVNKTIVGSSHNSLIQVLFKEYDQTVSVFFIDNLQYLANNWLLYTGFSVGASDCIATKEQEIENVITRCFMEAKGVEQTTNIPHIKEIKINASLSKARDHGMRIAKEALSSENNFISTVTSGSKGDYFNIAQITGLLGQQNFSGKRIEPTMNNNTRTLPHYPFKDLSKETEFESRGFVKNSFIRGISPREFWFHAITGREGITDTAMKTSMSGYTQRRMIKLGEDLQVQYDGTVRNASGSIIQFNYGGDGFDGSNTVIVDNKPQICDVSRLVDRINLKYE